MGIGGDRTEAEVSESGVKPAPVGHCRFDQHVQILGKPRFGVRCDGKAAHQQEAHPMVDQRGQELAPVGIE